MRSWWRFAVPLVVWLFLASIPCPAGLTPAGWRYHALFVGVIVALILEPMPAPAVGLVGVTLATSLGYVSPEPRGIDQVGAERLLRSHRLAHLRCAGLLHRLREDRARAGGSPFPSSVPWAGARSAWATR